MKIREIVSFLETIAPPQYQESYDNAGLIVGDPDTELTGAIICLDAIEDVVAEAEQKDCNLIIAHHPIIFSGLKKLNGKNYVERTVIRAIRSGIAIFAAHTNLDNMFRNGVNSKIAEKLGLVGTRILDPKTDILRKLVTFVPVNHAENLRNALFGAGAGNIGNYDECSFSLVGMGSFRGNEESKPFVGEQNLRHHEAESRIEVIFEVHNERKLLSALRQAHPYEEVAYDIYKLANPHPQIGAGMIGVLPKPVKTTDFLKFVKKQMDTACIRHTALCKSEIHSVAVCGGAGSFLLKQAIGNGADIFITGDFKYHEFFDAENKIVIADIGHFESEQFTMELFYDLISKKFPTFALHLTAVNTNPVFYA